ncbi:AraC family transcriptional regulator [Frigidibacter sp. MR17.24]|uniref:AraC family transcriptional regulator n=1 Tax=Frigidibacter sp. MR17.24 TaxID=3127345 RepID=UPI003012C6D4
MDASRIWRSRALGGFDALESRVTRFEYSPHRHAEVVIAAYGAGYKQVRCGQQAFDVAAGDLLVIGPETLHRGATGAGPGWHYLSVYLSPGQIAAATGLAPGRVEAAVAGHRLHRRAGAMARLRAALAEPEVAGAGPGPSPATPPATPPAPPLALAELLSELLAAPGGAARGPGPAPGLRRVRERLADDLCATPSLHDLARLAELSPEHLSRRFRQAFGQSPFQHLTALRTRRARELIAAGVPLAQAAQAAGFADQSHLNRWFKRTYAVTPGAFAASRVASSAFKTGAA